MVVFNPAAGRHGSKMDRLPHLAARFERIGVETVARPTHHSGHAFDLVRDSVGRFDAIAAWGGDGTVNEVSAALLGSRTPMVVLPGGTVNVFARECGIPLSLDRAVAAIPDYRVQQVYMGLADERPFLLMAGVGLDASVVHRLEHEVPELKLRLGAWAFLVEGFRSWLKFDYCPLTVDCGGAKLEASLLVVGNLRRYAHQFFVTPQARLSEPMLELVAFKGQTRRSLLRFVIGILGGFHQHYRDVVRVQVTESSPIHVSVENPRQSVHCQLDGEPAGFTPMIIRVAPEPLSVFLP